MAELAEIKEELDLLTECEVGDHLEFFYRGYGTHNNETREVSVEEVHYDHIVAVDLIHGGVKRFNDLEASEIQVVNPVESRLDFQNARETVAEASGSPLDIIEAVSGEELAKLYTKYVNSDVECRFEDGYLKFTPASDSFKFATITSRTLCIKCGNKKLTLFLHDVHNQVGINTYVDGDSDYINADMTAEEVLEKISDFYLENKE